MGYAFKQSLTTGHAPPDLPSDEWSCLSSSSSSSSWDVLMVLMLGRMVAGLERSKSSDPSTAPGMTLLSELREVGMEGLPAGVVFKDEKAKTVYVIFRGTQTTTDLARIGRVAQTLFPTETSVITKVHKGFLSAFNAMGAPAALQRWIPGAEHVYIAGYSLGGAMVMLALWEARDLLSSPKTTCDVAVFACPRVGDTGFAAAIDSILFPGNNQGRCRLSSVINLADGVPFMPAVAMPNMSSPNEPWRFSHPRLMTTAVFVDNQGSFLANHMMPTYLLNLCNATVLG